MQVGLNPSPTVPLRRIPEGHLSERHTVKPLRTPDVKVPVDDCRRVETAVPTAGSASPAPRRESRNSWQHSMFFLKRKVIDQDLGETRRIGSEPCLGILAACSAPRVPVWKRVRVQDEFVAHTEPPSRAHRTTSSRRTCQGRKL